MSSFLTTLRHPHLLPVEVLKRDSGRVGLLCDPLEGTLADRLQHCQTVGLSGIPRRERLPVRPDTQHGVAPPRVVLGDDAGLHAQPRIRTTT